MTRYRPIGWLAAMLAVSLSVTPGASGQTGVIEGHVRAESGGAPVQFALVRLLRADSNPSPTDAPPEGITNADGHFRFDTVPPGRYRVEVVRIGFRPLLSDPVPVVAGKTAQLDLRMASSRWSCRRLP